MSQLMGGQSLTNAFTQTGLMVLDPYSYALGGFYVKVVDLVDLEPSNKGQNLWLCI